MYWNSFRLLADTNTQCNVESAQLVVKKTLGSLLEFLRTRHSCAGVLKALKPSFKPLHMCQRKCLSEPCLRYYILTRFRGLILGFVPLISNSAEESTLLELPAWVPTLRIVVALIYYIYIYKNIIYTAVCSLQSKMMSVSWQLEKINA